MFLDTLHIIASTQGNIASNQLHTSQYLRIAVADLVARASSLSLETYFPKRSRHSFAFP